MAESKLVSIWNIESLSYAATMLKFTEIYAELPDAGQLEFKIMDFRLLVEYYNQVSGTDDKLAELLYGSGYGPKRLMIWDERSIARALLTTGFYRVWTGKTPECGEYEVSVQARKYILSS